jgi:hypothetical protein
MACLLFATPLALAGCGGLSAQERQGYLDKASSYEQAANQMQKEAGELRSSSYIRGLSDSQRQAVVASAKAKEDLASEYRQQALKYRELAAK